MAMNKRSVDKEKHAIEKVFKEKEKEYEND